MAIEFKSVKGYMHLDVWVLANIIQLSTFEFCRRFLNQKNDPCGRLFDQMMMAARSITANIAEGLSRHQTSTETEMRLTDVARASLSELLGDYFFISMASRCEPWAKQSEEAKTLAAVTLDRSQYTDDWQREAWLHIMQQKTKFDPWTQSKELAVSVNAMMQLCNRAISMLQKLLQNQLERFRQEGGFTENLTAERLTALKQAAIERDAPTCPACGKPMLRRLQKRGAMSGHEFWGCSDYPNCKGTRDINDKTNQPKTK